MMMNAKTLFTTLCLCWFATVALPGVAQTAEYTKFNIKGQVQLEIPSDWSISDAEQRKRVKEFGDKLAGIPTQHIASFVAQSYPAPSRTMVRVSFIPMKPPVTQTDVRQQVQANKQQVLQELADVWREESPKMWAGLAKNGVKEVGRPRFAVETIGGQTALTISYGRTSTANPLETMRVTQYHVPLGAEKALITLSYIERDPQATAAHNRLKSSIVIQYRTGSNTETIPASDINKLFADGNSPVINPMGGVSKLATPPVEELMQGFKYGAPEKEISSSLTSDLDTGNLVLMFGYTLICVVAAFFLRQKYPHKYSIGVILCVFAPAWGHIYVKSKHNWVPWIVFMSLERGVNKALADEKSFIFLLIIGGLSAIVMYFRILSTKNKSISSQQSTEADKDQNYISYLDNHNKSRGMHRLSILLGFIGLVGWVVFVLVSTEFCREVELRAWLIILAGLPICFLIPFGFVRGAAWVIEGFGSGNDLK